MSRARHLLPGSGVLGHPHRFTLQGSPGSLSFPPLCPNCGNRASAEIEYAKVFQRVHSNAPTEHLVTSVRVPMRFANDFIALNRQFEYRADSTSAVADRKKASRTMWLVGAVVLALALLGYLLG